MPTSVHIPRELLDELDRRARHLRVSRNRLIVGAIENELSQATRWSPGFFESLSAIEPEEAQAIDDMMRAIRRARSRKGPPKL
jgi:metal-responsive CopG/Arc/MetJ family transcriptional regulator